MKEQAEYIKCPAPCININIPDHEMEKSDSEGKHSCEWQVHFSAFNIKSFPLLEWAVAELCSLGEHCYLTAVQSIL